MRTGPLSVNTLIVSLENGNVFVVDPADCAFSGDEGVVVSRVREKNKTVSAVILTHGHFDHVSGLPALLRAFPSAKVLIHKNDASLIGKNSALSQKRHLEAIGFLDFLPFVSSLPEATDFLEDEKELEVEKSWRVLFTPGHTQGSVCLWNEREGVLISGDTLFDGSYGRTDLPGGDEVEIHKSLSRLLKTVPRSTLVYSGHDFRPFRT